jgi:hypothetical protein
VAKIVRILSVTDTRQWDDAGGKWSPIPGSGEAHTCDRCGRLHEVWAQVLLDDDSQMTVGTGCARQEDPEIIKRMASLDRFAKRIRQLQHERVKAQISMDLFLAAKAEVDALPRPPVEYVGRAPGGDSLIFQMGKATVWQPAPRGIDQFREFKIEPYRLENLEYEWAQYEMARRGWSQSPRYWLSSVENEIVRISDKMHQD